MQPALLTVALLEAQQALWQPPSLLLNVANRNQPAKQRPAILAGLCYLIMKRKIIGKGKAFLIHFLLATITTAACWAFITTWYPAPYFDILHGREILALAVVIDLTLGPLVTLILYNPLGTKKELLATASIATLLQATALSYGLYQAASSRPIFLAFEGDKFRIVSRPDFKDSELKNASEEFRNIKKFGVKIISTKLLDAGAPGLLESIQLDLQGIHPAYRPQRWQDYENSKTEILQHAKAIDLANNKNIESLKPEKNRKENNIVLTIPIVAYEGKTNWTAIIDPNSANVIGFLKFK
ncbi:hypothetical protein [Pseudomonas oryzihabitans]|uniref:hypothetical protein n=1 Tax=Pseudomonas oryzihabitans TaxID=47885 RepID=UPI00135E4E30|nr:hypothetical protein [Pseudomonas oryzihabitans]MXS20704.1 hypothetical protein [Pseudomonas oryzihabitans]